MAVWQKSLLYHLPPIYWLDFNQPDHDLSYVLNLILVTEKKLSDIKEELIDAKFPFKSRKSTVIFIIFLKNYTVINVFDIRGFLNVLSFSKIAE